MTLSILSFPSLLWRARGGVLFASIPKDGGSELQDDCRTHSQTLSVWRSIAVGYRIQESLGTGQRCSSFLRTARASALERNSRDLVLPRGRSEVLRFFLKRAKAHAAGSVGAKRG